MNLLNHNLLDQGFIQTSFTYPKELISLVEQEKWDEVDKLFLKLTSSDGELFKFLRTHHEFSSIEFIISIRDSINEWEEDGIWHDDGSRLMAFSLSLSLNPEKIEGGKLGMRKKGETHHAEIPTPRFGEIIIFLTGRYGYEHKIHQVKAGKRVIIAGWCS